MELRRKSLELGRLNVSTARILEVTVVMEFASVPPGSRDVEVPGEGFQVNFGIIRGSKPKD
jgi:hypothetical protein